jgi:anti-sigma factor RsiW
MAMRCPIESRENAELLLDYCARKLDPSQARALEEHIARCPACQEFRVGQKLLWDALDQWEAHPVSVDFDRRLYRRIEEDQGRQRWWQRLMIPLLRPAVPLAATACLLLVGGYMIREPAPTVDSAVVREVEQVENTLDDLEMLKQFDLVAKAEDKTRTL